MISDEAAELKTFEEYGLRFDIEENFLDDKSNGVPVRKVETPVYDFPRAVAPAR